MDIDGNEYPNVWCASGARNFDGKGWWYTTLYKFFLFLFYSWSGAGFVTKTTTLERRDGFMPLKSDGKSPRELFPRCIKVFFFSGHTVNSVGLSGPGINGVLAMLRKNPPKGPFMLSIMCLSANKLDELDAMLQTIIEFKKTFPVPFTVQLNLACPNTGEDLNDFYELLDEMLDLADSYGLKLFLNFNPLVPIDVLVKADKHPACAGFWIGNTIQWGSTDLINWKKFSDWRVRRQEGRLVSPLLRRLDWEPDPNKPDDKGPVGGLSGPVCRQFTIDTIMKARREGVTKPIIGGNGFQLSWHLDRLWEAQANGVALGIVAMIRPWRLRKLIKHGLWIWPQKFEA